MRVQAAVFLFWLISGFGAEAKRPGAGCPVEQLHFSAEDAHVDCPIRIPDDIAAALRNDTDVRQTLESEHTSAADPLPPSWFLVSAVHLAGAAETDIVVVGKGPLSGANIKTFWVFRPTNNAHELMLKVAEHDLIITNRRWKGYRVIKVMSATAILVRTEWYRFEDGQYNRFKSTGWEKIN